MSSVDIQEILKLSVAERIELVEAIWDSIADAPENLPVTAAQKRELDRRLAEQLAGFAQAFLPAAQAHDSGAHLGLSSD